MTLYGDANVETVVEELQDVVKHLKAGFESFETVLQKLRQRKSFDGGAL